MSSTPKKTPQHRYDPQDVFIGKRVFWKPIGWDRCYFCDKKSKQTCSNCHIVTYCSALCETNHRQLVHSPKVCGFMSKYYERWKEFPIVIGSDRDKQNCVFASQTLPSGTSILFDEALVSVYFLEKTTKENVGWTHRPLIGSIDGISEEFTYRCSLTEYLIQYYKEIVDMGIHQTTALGTSEEHDAVEKITQFLYEQRKNKETMDQNQLQLWKATVSLAYGIIRRNSILVTSTIGNVPFCRAFFPLLSLFNHDCNPNCKYYYLGNGVIQLITTKEVKKGEELCFDYQENSCLIPFSLRKETLAMNFAFDCHCPSCTVGIDPAAFRMSQCASKTLQEISQSENMNDIVQMILGDKDHFSIHARCCMGIWEKLCKKLFQMNPEFRIENTTMQAFILVIFYSMIHLIHASDENWNIFNPQIRIMLTTLCVFSIKFKNKDDIVQYKKTLDDDQKALLCIVCNYLIQYVSGQFLRHRSIMMELILTYPELSSSVANFIQGNTLTDLMNE